MLEGNGLEDGLRQSVKRSGAMPWTLDSRRVGHDVPYSILRRDDSVMHYWVGVTDRDWFEMLRVYNAFDGRSLTYVPNRLTDQPGREFLEWNNFEVYLG